VNKPIAPADSLQQAALGAVVEEADVAPGGKVVKREDEAEDEVLDEGTTAAVFKDITE